MTPLDDFLSRVKDWAPRQTDLCGVLLVGSYARGAARRDSDVDLMLLTSAPERYLDSTSFAEHFGAVNKWEKEDWGRVTSLRVWYQNGLEVEYGIARPDWASLPVDPGTQQVLSNGMQIIFDPESILSKLISLGLSPDRPSKGIP